MAHETEPRALDLFRRVSVGFDGRTRSEPAVEAALDLHLHTGCQFDVVHVSDIRNPHPLGETAEAAEKSDENPIAKLWEEEAQAVRNRAKQRLAELIRAKGIDGVEAEGVLSFEVGHPAQLLSDHAQATNPDVLIFGPHERRGRFDFGSTARALMGHTKCSLWFQPGPVSEIRRILVPTDLTTHGEDALRTARQLATAYHARVTLLHCYLAPTFSYSSDAIEAEAATAQSLTDADRATDRSAFEHKLASLRWGDVEFEGRWSEGRPEEVVLELEQDFDVTVIGTHGRTGLSAAVFGNVAYGVLKCATRPVLAVRIP